MVLGGVGSSNENDVRCFDVADGVRHGTTSECCSQTGYGGGMSEPGAMIDVVGFQHRPCKLIGDIILLVRYSRGGQNTKTVRSTGFLYFVESSGHRIQGLVPGGLPECTVLLDHGSGQTLGRVDEIISKPTLDAQTAIVRGNIFDT